MNSEEITKIIESCHLNFLIGSGTSKPFLETLGVIEGLLNELSEKEESDEKTIIDASIKKYYFDESIKGNLEIFTGTSDDLKKTQIAYKDFINALNTILIKRKSNLVSKQVNVFTTNMDLFLDYTIESLGLVCNDGFSGKMNPKFGTENFHNSIRKTSTHYEYQSELPLFNLFKLHGSLDWKINHNEIVYDNGLRILKKVSKIEIPEEILVEIDYEDKEGEWWYHSIDELYRLIKKEKIELHDEHGNFLEAYNQFVMINPTKEKFKTTTRDLTFYELLRMYSNHLERENSVLFVLGFSFADEHVREITKRVAASNPTLLIIIFAFDKHSKEDIEKIMPKRSNIKIIYDEEDKIKYSLKQINEDYFVKLAKDLEK